MRISPGRVEDDAGAERVVGDVGGVGEVEAVVEPDADLLAGRALILAEPARRGVGRRGRVARTLRHDHPRRRRGRRASISLRTWVSTRRASAGTSSARAGAAIRSRPRRPMRIGRCPRGWVVAAVITQTGPPPATPRHDCPVVGCVTTSAGRVAPGSSANVRPTDELVSGGPPTADAADGRQAAGGEAEKFERPIRAAVEDQHLAGCELACRSRVCHASLPPGLAISTARSGPPCMCVSWATGRVAPRTRPASAGFG